MIDPNIALSYRPTNLGIETPAQMATANQQVTNLQNVGKLQQQELQTGQLQQTALGQENQIRKKTIDDAQAFNQAIQQNTSTDPVTQAPVLNHDGVAETLERANHGDIALKYRSTVNTLKQADLEWQAADAKMRDEKFTHVASLFGPVLDAPEAARPALYALARQRAIANGYAKENELPTDYTPQTEQMLGIIHKQALTPLQQSQDKHGEAMASAAMLRADGYYQRMLEYQQQNQLLEQRLEETIRHNKQTETQGTRRLDQRDTQLDQGQQKIDNPATGGSGRASGALTPNAQAVEGRFEKKQISDARKQLNAIHQQRSALGNATETADGQYYVDPKSGKVSTQTMTEDIRKTLTDQLANATNEGRRIIEQYGGDKSGGVIRTNEFSDLAPNATPTQTPAPANAPAKTAPQVADGTIIKNPKTGERRQMKGGKWIVLTPAR